MVNDADSEKDLDFLNLTSDIVIAHVSNNRITAAELPPLIASVYSALRDLGTKALPAEESPKDPAVPIRSSVKPDYLVCLEDGKKLKMLKRYLRAKYDISPDEYRRRWCLPPDYPMVSPSYTERRSEFAKKIGLGRGVRKGR